MAITNITMENHQFFNGKTHYLFRLPTISIHTHLVLPPSIRSARLATRHCTVSSCPRAAAVRKAVSPEKSRRSWKGRGRASPVFSRLNLKRRWVWNILYQIGMLYIYIWLYMLWDNKDILWDSKDIIRYPYALWYIYLQNWVIFRANVGKYCKYSSTMEHIR